jgi:hypothetical protein
MESAVAGSQLSANNNSRPTTDQRSKTMPKTVPGPSDVDIFRRIVDPEKPFFSEEAARGILRLRFAAADQARMNELAAKNREGGISQAEDQELENYIRAGQILGILQSKARRSLPSNEQPSPRKRRKS